jgi:hypothetical protein
MRCALNVYELARLGYSLAQKELKSCNKAKFAGVASGSLAGKAGERLTAVSQVIGVAWWEGV